MCVGEGIGIHEGPRATALLADDEPLTSALVPATAAQPRLLPSGAVEYSKGAAVLRMLQSFWEAGRPGSFQVRDRRQFASWQLLGMGIL